jgi:ADP-ribosylglycohydrolase
MAPVGIANAGDPQGAYAEAIDVAGAHQSSYGREAAGVFAAAVAAAMVPGATTTEVVEAALSLAKDGTRKAVQAVAEAANGVTDWEQAIPLLRKAIEPFDSVGPDYRDQSLDARRPSRTKAIEELPVALGFVLVSEGDVRRAVLGGTNYGRDADSIASMAGAITGALGGLSGVPAEWAGAVAEASRTDLERPGVLMAAVARDLHASDTRRWARRVEVLENLT